MGVFDDKKFEDLDWISQATEPINSRLNDVLQSIPDSITIDFEIYRRVVSNGYDLDLSIQKIVSYMVEQYSKGANLAHEELGVVDRCFELQITGEKLIVNFEDNTISGGEIKLVKINTTMDEKVLQSIMGKDGLDGLIYCSMETDGYLNRMNEIMELLGKCDDGLKSRSERSKRRQIVSRLHTIFSKNEWKIRDTELANKVGFWVKDYVCNGNLASFSNFCRLKVMTHKDQPIYSMEEIE